MALLKKPRKYNNLTESILLERARIHGHERAGKVGTVREKLRRDQIARDPEFYKTYLEDPRSYDEIFQNTAEKVDTFSPKERKFYDFFMNKKSQNSFVKRILFAQSLANFIFNDLRYYSKEELEYFNSFFGDFVRREKDPRKLLSYIHQLANTIIIARKKAPNPDPENFFSDTEKTSPS